MQALQSHTPVFSPADILLPKSADLTRYSVVACDQYTSEPDYWTRVKAFSDGFQSTLFMIFPEIYLKTADFDKTIFDINQTMEKYLQDDLFYEEKNSYIYIQRSLKNGAVRHGLIGKIDLEAYDFSIGSQSAVRATEGTVLDRIPPRVKIRENAPIELPHVMLLLDDPQKAVIEPLANAVSDDDKLYDFTLMEGSGQLRGYRVAATQAKRISALLETFADEKYFQTKYDVSTSSPLTFAVGDGNHSLATARQCYLNLKAQIGDAALSHPARYALCELVNLHDRSLEFEAIHRIVFNVDSAALMAALYSSYDISEVKALDGQYIEAIIDGAVKPLYIKNPRHSLPVGSLQLFLDEHVQKHGGEIDYIHGKDIVKSLSKQKNTIGFLLPDMNKNELFKTVIKDGALPRKTFSMGEACDKRFYFEGRRIK